MAVEQPAALAVDNLADLCLRPRGDTRAYRELVRVQVGVS